MPLGWVSLPLFDHKDVLASGLYALRLWPCEKANPIGAAVPNVSVYGPETPTLYVQFEAFSQPLVLPAEVPDTSRGGSSSGMPPPDVVKRLKVCRFPRSSAHMPHTRRMHSADGNCRNETFVLTARAFHAHSTRAPLLTHSARIPHAFRRCSSRWTRSRS